MATMAIPAQGCATLCVAGKKPFLRWLQGLFRHRLAPHAQRVAELTGRGFVREIEKIDRGFDTADLPEDLIRSSVVAGAAVLEARSGLRSCPVLSRMAAAVESGTMPGHHVSVFAAQAAVLHLPVQGILVGLAFDEWRRANQPASAVAEFRGFFPDVTDVAASVFAGSGDRRFRIA